MASAAKEVAHLEAAFQGLAVDVCKPLSVVTDENAAQELASGQAKNPKVGGDADGVPEVEGKDQLNRGLPSKQTHMEDSSDNDPVHQPKDCCMRLDVCCGSVSNQRGVVIRSPKARGTGLTTWRWPLWSASLAWPSLPKHRHSKAGRAFERLWKSSSRLDNRCCS